MRLLQLLAALFPLTVLSTAPAFASAAKEDPDPEGIKYFELYPRLITNYAKSGDKLGYFQVGIQLKVQGSANVELLKTHLPLLQDTVLWLMRSQTEETIKNLQNRETLRLETLKQLQEKVEAETKKKDVIVDVLFTQYMWQ